MNRHLREQYNSLTAFGKRLCQAYSYQLEFLPVNTREILVNEYISELAEWCTMPVRLMEFEAFAANGSFPRFPNVNITTNLDTINRNESLIVFISHLWLRGNADLSVAHPDNESNEQYLLCVEGIPKLWTIHAPSMKKCYVWMDYGCCNQDNDHIEELAMMGQIMECCDVVFTPIVDNVHHTVYNCTPGSYFTLYHAELWNGPNGYLNRGWCRFEMSLAAHLPLLPNSPDQPPRHTKFRVGLAHACLHNRRMHVLYGTQESRLGQIPRVLPPLSFSYFEQYKPELGQFSRETDRAEILKLIYELFPENVFHYSAEIYEGEMNELGLRHGQGTIIFENGDSYVGSFENQVREGYGILILTNGYVYQGEWRNDKRHGMGVAHYANGVEYEGEYADDTCCGVGVMREALGNVYHGSFKGNVYHGQGELKYSNGVIFVGEFEEGKTSVGCVFRRETVKKVIVNSLAWIM